MLENFAAINEDKTWKNGLDKAEECITYALVLLLLLFFMLPWWLSSRESACNVGDIGDVHLTPGWGRYPAEGNGNPL